MNKREWAQSTSILVVRFYPGKTVFRTDLCHLDSRGVENLIHRHESIPEKYGIEAFRELVKPSIDAGIRRAIIDLVEIRWAPSEVIATLLVVEAFLRDGDVACVVANPNPRVMSVLTVTGLIQHLEIRETMEEAIGYLTLDEDAASV